jgi:murein DD-endopeptidase MepM/ murein hydrolase activator NlpD
MPQASPVYAPAAGYVYKVVDNNSDYYNYIVLVHNYGYITLYGHVSKSYVKA